MSTEDRLRRLFADVFGVAPEAITDDDSPQSIPSWDSVSHLNLVFALEAEFDVQFEAEEIPELITYRAIRRRIG